ncbi:hypothetical protein L208DRAFT_1399724 [Tricholoma matsutake]|nr:hypothetical protein L208DRAFT_1399724 [Tricholoma matsutake 945]
MKLWSSIALSVVAVLFQVVQAYDFPLEVKLNYYGDQGCNGPYMGTWRNTAFWTCLEYKIDGAGSFNIAGCEPGPHCVCIFYSEPNCQGVSVAVFWVQDSAGSLTGDCGDTASTIKEPQSVQCWLGG